ncbi:peptidase S10 [Chloroflexus islandicus]|uniref:Peptidase S10 n=1 Tax=Chloroflexus islandicus TaxID=1707952 RepID=A0A178LUD7_9CHLR|nr:peptidase S10 [Chloroflexus islandicus]OAN37081.1 peptidase S10 [Chloroflexus islandicus]
MTTTQPAAAPAMPPADQLVQTQHTVVINGVEIAYTATAGVIIMKEEAEKDGVSAGEQARAGIFFVAYTRDDVSDASRRPLTFAFNGGPGSSSVWLHLGLLGPQRVLMTEEGWPLPPPGRLAPNPYSLLDVSDLVFIDPVSTGYSRPVAGESAKQFHDFRKDIESVGDFIRLYTSRYGRWLSPKYLAGESYGTTRAAGLAGYLQERHGLYLNGLMLISAVLHFQTLSFDHGNDLPYMLFLPAYTATAFYHRRLEPELQRDLVATLRAAEAFAFGDYALALLQGDQLDPATFERIATQLARYTGLSRDYIARSRLRIRDDRFVKELLRDQHRTVGRLDSRFTGSDRDAVGETVELDPSLAAITGPYTAALNHYVREQLGFSSDLPYEILTERVWPWSFNDHQNRYVDVAETLRRAMHRNPALRVHVASGYYDLATPYFATRYTLNHLALDPALRRQISESFYPAGHMMYIQETSLAALKAVLADFVAVAPEEGASQ